MSISNEPCENSLLKLYDFMMFEGLIVTKSYEHSQARKNVRAFRLAWAAACAFRKLRPSTIENEERRGGGEKREEKEKNALSRETSDFHRASWNAANGVSTRNERRENHRSDSLRISKSFARREALYVRAHARIRVFMKDAKRERGTESSRAQWDLKKNFVEAIGREISYTRLIKKTHLRAYERKDTD